MMQNMSLSERDLVHVRNIPARKPLLPKIAPQMTHVHESLIDALKKAIADCAVLKKMVDKLSEERSTLQTKIAQVSLAAATASDDHERKLREITADRDDLDTKLGTLSTTYTTEKIVHEASILALHAQVKSLQEAKASNETLVADLRAEVASLKGQATDMAAMHSEKTTELRDQIKTLTAQLESERSQRIELQAQSAKLKENLCDVKSTMKCTMENLSARLKQAKNKAATAKKALITHQNVSRHIESGLQEKVAKLEEKAATNETRLNAQITTLKVELKGVEDQLEHVQKEEEERFAMGIADAEAARIRALQQEEELMRLKPLSTELRLLRVKILKCALEVKRWIFMRDVRTVVKVGDITRHTRPRRITSPLLSLFGSAEYTFQEDDIAFPLREGDMYSKSLEVLVYCEDGDELIGSLVLPLINFESNGRAKEYNLEMSPGFQNIGNHGEITLKLELWKKS
ncbi:hypothetical protein LEN26_018720 [Aphanomyces euteiches]|nr:hypothetical protein LEN26_018720 [Aphanomyces euteiches]